MRVVDFVAALPTGHLELQKLRHTLGVFRLVENEIRTAGGLPLTREDQDELADKIGADRFMVEDMVTAFLDQKPTIFKEFIGQGFWTFGRRTPRYGTPWSNLVFYDPRASVELLVRYDGSFIDEEEPPSWIICHMISTGSVPYEALAALAADCGSLDIWWKLDDRNVSGKLVFV
jgi:hypothetical protein